MKCLVALLVSLCVLTTTFALAAEGIQIDSAFPGGTEGRVERPGEDHAVFTPKTGAPGGQFFYACVRVNQLPTGKTLQLDLVWPAAVKFDPASGPKPTGDAARKYSASFVPVLPKIIVQSSDLRNWKLVEGVKEVDERTVRVPVAGTGSPTYIATQTPYHIELYNDLIRHVREREPGAVRETGKSNGGQPINIVCLEATNPASRPRTVFIQAYQHLTEFSGPLVADAAIRYLLDAGSSARRDLSFQIVPMFHLDGLTPGARSTARKGQTSNPNRDWVAKTWPEVRAVDAFIRENMAAGRKYVLGFDLHNGWSSPKASGACYTIYPKGWVDAAVIDKQKEFIEFMYARTDHEKPGRYWAHEAEGTFKEYFYRTTGTLSYTVEFSRFMWWNRAAGEFEPARPEHPARFARQFIDAIAEFCTARK